MAMQGIGDIAKRPRKTLQTTAKSEWSYLVGQFCDVLNEERKTAGYGAYSHARVAAMLKILGKDDAQKARGLFQYCSTGRGSFGFIFGGMVKRRRAELKASKSV
jgi:hypothetical protein